MATETRKQRERAEREALLLDAAERLLLEHGYLGVTMDRVAEATEFAKGTVYQHFASKEDVLAALSVRLMTTQQEFFERAVELEGRSRERVAAIGVAYDLWVRLNPDRLRLTALVKQPSLRTKCSAERLAAIEESEAHCSGLLVGVVAEAVAQGDLDLPPGLEPGHLAHGLWALSFGAHQLALMDVDLDRLAVRDSFTLLRRHQHALLDGYGWRPLLAEWDYDAVRDRVLESVFPREARELEQRDARAAR